MAKFHETYKGLATGPTGCPVTDEDARELEKLLDTGEYTPFKKASHSVESFSPGERADISVISDDSIDADKEIILPKLIDLSRFQKNPIVTFGHDWYSPPIGKSLWQKVTGNVLKAKTAYASRPEGHPESKEWLPDTLYSLVKEGMLPGKSIGGIAKYREITAEDLVKHPDWKGAKRVLESAVLVEYSVVTAQCNPNAVVQAVAKGALSISDDVLQSAFPDIWDLVKQKREQQQDMPVIKDFRTLQDLIKEQEAAYLSKFAEECEKVPSHVNDMLEVMMGRV